eukprot:m.124313 g.124313  ORF g.124313 m.124313 type:complete len:693 (-) comp13773_c0_seq5:1472-3550(-)
MSQRTQGPKPYESPPAVRDIARTRSATSGSEQEATRHHDEWKQLFAPDDPTDPATTTQQLSTSKVTFSEHHETVSPGGGVSHAQAKPSAYSVLSSAYDRDQAGDRALSTDDLQTDDLHTKTQRLLQQERLCTPRPALATTPVCQPCTYTGVLSSRHTPVRATTSSSVCAAPSFANTTIVSTARGGGAATGATGATGYHTAETVRRRVNDLLQRHKRPPLNVTSISAAAPSSDLDQIRRHAEFRARQDPVFDDAIDEERLNTELRSARISRQVQDQVEQDAMRRSTAQRQVHQQEVEGLMKQLGETIGDRDAAQGRVRELEAKVLALEAEGAVQTELNERQAQQLVEQHKAAREHAATTEAASAEIEMLRAKVQALEQAAEEQAATTQAQATKLEEVQREAQEHAASASASTAEAKHLHARVQELEIKQQSLSSEGVLLREELQALRTKHAAQEERLGAALSSNTRLSSEREDLIAQVARLSNEIAAKKRDATGMREQTASLAQRFERQRLQMETMASELEIASISHTRLRKDLRQERELVKQLRARVGAGAQQCAALEDREDKMRAERDALDQAMAEARDTEQQLLEQIDTLKAQVEETDRKAASALRQRKDLAKKVEAALKVASSLHRVFQEAQAHAAKCAARGYFASKARQLQDAVRNTFDMLTDYIVDVSESSSSRRDVLVRLKELETA